MTSCGQQWRRRRGRRRRSSHCNNNAIHCSTEKHTATHCNRLQLLR